MNWGAVKLLVTDFDGVWTDDAVYVDQNGIESVRCLRADGFGITRLQAAGVPVIVLSAEVNPVVAARCEKLKVRCYQGVSDKLSMLKTLLRYPEQWDGAQVAYMGNDVNDIECLKAVGFPIVVRNAEREVFAALGYRETGDGDWFHPQWADTGGPPSYQTDRAGGYGAVREVCDLILAARSLPSWHP